MHTDRLLCAVVVGMDVDDDDQDSRNVNASNCALNLSPTLDGRRPIYN